MAKAKIITLAQKINSKRTFDALMAIAEKNNIYVFETEDNPMLGFYFERNGHDIIWLYSKLPVETKVEVLAHELGHFKLHNFRNHKEGKHAFSTSADSPKEIEANRFGKKLVGLISRNLLRGPITGL